MSESIVGRNSICHLKESMGRVVCVQGVLSEVIQTEVGLFLKYKAEEGHDFVVPNSNIAYLEVFSDEYLEQQRIERESKDTQGEEINRAIEDRMKKVEGQYANQSTNGQLIREEEKGDSKFVF